MCTKGRNRLLVSLEYDMGARIDASHRSDSRVLTSISSEIYAAQASFERSSIAMAQRV